MVFNVKCVNENVNRKIFPLSEFSQNSSFKIFAYFLFLGSQMIVCENESVLYLNKIFMKAKFLQLFIVKNISTKMKRSRKFDDRLQTTQR